LAEILNHEDQRTVTVALEHAYRRIQELLDGKTPNGYDLSRTHDDLAAALQVVGSSGAIALGLDR
jgi:hypothetical protein